MQRVALLLVVGACAPTAAIERTAVTPVQKVINMLNDMLAKGKTEKEDETVSFAAFRVFCDQTKVEKAEAISKGKAHIDKLEGDIAKAEEVAMSLAKAIENHNADINAWDAERSEITTTRKKEEADYKKIYNDYTSAMGEASRVAATIKAGNAEEKSLIEVRSDVRRLVELRAITPEARHALSAFLQEDDAATNRIMAEVSGAPEAKTYESHSFGALGVIEEMEENFEDKRDELEKEEMKKKAAYDLMNSDLLSSVASAERERGEKESRMQQAKSEKFQKADDLARTKTEVQDDTKFLSDLNIECESKSVDYEKRQVSRAGEITALSKAIEIMSGSAVSAGSKSLPSLAQSAAAAPSLAQLRSVTVSPVQRTAAALLAERAHRSQSRLLELVASRAGADPMKKVVKMIEDMIGKLMQEANEDAEHEGFCDQEMGKNKFTRDQKTTDVETLTATSAKLAADIQRYSTQIAQLGDDIAEIDAAVIKLKTERENEKAKNTATIEEAKQAAAATQKAMTVLREYYASAAEAAALAQFRAGTFGKEPYTGMGGTAGGVVAMLEVIESDFKRLDAETTADEMQAASDYNAFMTDASKSKAVKTADMTNKAKMKTGAEADLLAAKKDLKSTKEELDAALAYFEKLKPSCVEAGESYAQRVAKRKEEIESLKEALQILNQE